MAVAVNTSITKSLTSIPIPPEAARLFWAWFEAHQDTVLLKKKVFGLFTATITVGQLEVIFAQLFGPRPMTTGSALLTV